MKLLSYNIRNSLFHEEKHSDELNNWKFRREALLGLIKKADPDILALQEDTIEQTQYIRAGLKESHDFYGQEAFYPADDSYIGIYVRKGIKVAGSGAFWIAGDGKQQAKIEGSICYRHATYVLLEIKGAHMTIINVHLDHTKDEEVKAIEAQTFTRLVSEFLGTSSHKTFILGDFNGTPDTVTHDIMETSGFFDSAKLQNNEEPTNPHWLQYSKCERIDYIWISKDLKDNLMTYKVLGDTYIRKDGSFMEPSDHYPVFAEFSF